MVHSTYQALVSRMHLIHTEVHEFIRDHIMLLYSFIQCFQILMQALRFELNSVAGPSAPVSGVWSLDYTNFIMHLFVKRNTSSLYPTEGATTEEGMQLEPPNLGDLKERVNIP